MSLFASRRNTRNEETVIVKELQDLLGAREVPSDPIRRAKFWAGYYRNAAPAPPPPIEIRDPIVPPKPKQDPLFPDMEEAA